MKIPKISVTRYSSSLASRETPEQLAAQARIQAALAEALPKRKVTRKQALERKRQRNREWRARNLEMVKANDRRYREKHREKARAYALNYSRVNREKLLVRKFLIRQGQRISINDISPEMIQIYRDRAKKG